jgi:hypothetical protein
MPAETLVEQRLTAVEKAVHELERKLANLPSGPDWLERISGSLENEPAFEEVLQHGRAFRTSDRPPEDAETPA